VAIFSFSFPAYAKYGGGTGEPNDPYLIYTAEQLNTIGLNQEDADKHFKLMADIDLSAYQGDSFNRIGFYDPPEFAPDWRPPFTGVFDGNGHTISNFTYVVDVNEPLEENGLWGDECVGLFGVVSGAQAQIKNLGLIDPNIYPAVTCTERVGTLGAIAGRLSDGSITNCYVEGGTISGDISVGGLVGSNLDGTISNCYTTCNVTWVKGRWLRPLDLPFELNAGAFGGLAGSSRGWIYNCHATGSVRGASATGGLVGSNYCELSNRELEIGVISDSYATGEVTGDEYVGGLVGENYGKIRHCHVGGLAAYMPFDENCVIGSYATGNVSGNEQVGGLVGYSNGLTQDSYATGEVLGTVYTGGLVGFNGSGTIYHSYGSGAVSGTENVGGLVGRNGKGIIDCCYARGEVLGTTYVGGLIGTNFNMIRCCYAANAVSGIEKVGGLVGDNWSSGATIITSLWDIETSGLTDMCGTQSSSAIGCDNTYGKTTAEMQTESTFLNAGWDFVDQTANGTEDIWKISEDLDYPRLWWEKYGGGTGEPNNPYLIYTAEQMNQIGLHEEDWDKHFMLMADIDLSAYTGAGFNLIGSYESEWNEKSFTGIFEGNGHVISGFSCDGDASSNRFFVGLFRSVDGVNAKIQNLRIIDPNIIGGGIYIGALVGRLHNGTISNCVIETGRVVAPEGDEIGGIVGMNIQGVLSNCRAEGCVVQGRSRVGGLTGTNEGTIQNCYSSGEISGKRMIGGQVGGNFGSIINTYSTSIVTGLGSMQFSTGGLVGLNRGAIQASYATGDVTGMDDVGGLVGQNGDNSNITDSYATGHVSGRKRIGGFVGTCIQNNSLDKCYAAGSVSAEEDGGGLVGRSDNASIISASFWDIETSGQTTSAGGQGRTTAEMQAASTFLNAGWDFIDETDDGTNDIWRILEGQDYPRLWWEEVSSD
jgi:hypothetical protein